jgi:hypothetical protein
MRFTLLFAGFLEGIWMLLEGFGLLRGTVERASLRPWARLVQAVGLDPMRLGPLFLLLGVLWVLVTVALLSGSPRARLPATVLAIASLWYLIEGTGLAVIYLIALASLSRRPESP